MQDLGLRPVPKKHSAESDEADKSTVNQLQDKLVVAVLVDRRSGAPTAMGTAEHSTHRHHT